MKTGELEAEVERHNRLYFRDNAPQISDYEFDSLVEELRRRRPESKILSKIISDAKPGGGKIRHQTPMLSLDKCYDEKALSSWAGKFNGAVVASPKIDGCAVSLRYGGDGALFLAATRGDGLEGEEVTRNIRKIKSIPEKIAMSNVEVRGEIYMPLSVFEKYSGEFANPRNLAAGAIKQKDPEKTAQYNLSFFAYDLIGTHVKTQSERFDALEQLGFAVVEWKKVDRDRMQDEFRDMFSRRALADYELDGVVFRAEEISEQDRLGITAHHPRYAIAYKFQGDSETTTLVEVEWSVSRTGAITPVAIVEPVMLSGATVRRASLHNAGMVHKLGLTRGAKVLMTRRGGVIPNLESVVRPGGAKIDLPAKCPSCGSKVAAKDDFLYCTNPKECLKSKVGELEHFVGAIGIDGFGEKLIEKLYEEGLVTEPSEFFELTAKDLLLLERMGEKLADKLVANLREGRNVTLSVFLQSLGIRELGKHAAKVLERYGSVEKLFEVDEEELSSIKTIGPVIAREVVVGLLAKKTLIEKLLKHMKITAAGRARSGWRYAGKNFLFTGRLETMSRSEAEKMTEERGGVIAQSVGKTLDFLVVGDGGGAGSKLSKARKLVEAGSGMKIIDEKEFFSYFNE